MVDVQEIRGRRPRGVVMARWLSIAAAVVWVPVVGQYLGPASGYGLVLVVYVFGMFGVAKGRQAGRIVATVAAAALAFILLPYCWLGFVDAADPYGAVYALLDIAAFCLAAVSIGLCYRRDANRYIAEVTAARSVS